MSNFKENMKQKYKDWEKELKEHRKLIIQFLDNNPTDEPMLQELKRIDLELEDLKEKNKE